VKIRNGFVSNSSSSSFFTAVTKEGHEKVLSKMNDLEKTVVEAIVRKGKFAGIDIFTLSKSQDAGDFDSLEDELSGVISTIINELEDKGEKFYEDDVCDDVYDAVSEYQSKVSELGENMCIVHDASW